MSKLLTLFVDLLAEAGIEPGPRRRNATGLHSPHKGVNLI